MVEFKLSLTRFFFTVLAVTIFLISNGSAKVAVTLAMVTGLYSLFTFIDFCLWRGRNSFSKPAAWLSMSAALEKSCAAGVDIVLTVALSVNIACLVFLLTTV